MRLVVRIILATILLISQMSFGTVACVCPELTAPLPTSTAEPKQSCPVTGAKDCACCKHGNSAPAKKATQFFTNKASDCKISVSQAPVAEKWSNLAVPDGQVAVLPDQMVLPVAGTKVPVSPSAHLVVPRIRPPDTEANGLRAPPAR